MIMAMPVSGGDKRKQAAEETVAAADGETLEAGAPVNLSYEAALEQRVKELLRFVDGVGKVDVMVVIASSGEKVLRVDKSERTEQTKEKVAAGGERDVNGRQTSENTVLTGTGGNGGSPIVEKELKPEISGIVISAQGGGSPVVKAEISQAMEALFGLPPHKIKVLKRAE